MRTDAARRPLPPFGTLFPPFVAGALRLPRPDPILVSFVSEACAQR